ncbi:hypothetical protein ACFVWN_26890 [Nocardiopsis flavescens]|uniref:Cupin domain-containing protein n=1 Tax=Nocardiopsis flavescens TaxID=758803 RepID=A0A1M6V2S7_9ACTN|nr:hypothetical protein [Nocardiopsis flavescens]SHK75812.1 hypothetical protein SAMN05421803_13133 [Nocardiopsis flavescens]
MAYLASDPRSQLAARTGPDADAALEPQYFEFGALDPTDTTGNGGRLWTVRSANAAVVYAEHADGDTLDREDADETMLVVLPSEGRLTVHAGGESATVEPTALVTVRPGPWRYEAEGAPRLLRLHTAATSDVLDRAANTAAYADGPGLSAPAVPWPPPVGDAAIRVYGAIGDIAPRQGRLGRIFRGRHAMVNLLYPRSGPRDPRTLSPHTHDDFEQLSFVDAGRYVHHIRREWGNDRTAWRPDQHREIGGPSLTVIPPPLVHTSEAVGDGENRMIDIFAGPREDFSRRPGWVLNADDYPAPPWEEAR